MFIIGLTVLYSTHCFKLNIKFFPKLIMDLRIVIFFVFIVRFNKYETLNNLVITLKIIDINLFLFDNRNVICMFVEYNYQFHKIILQ